MLFFFSDSSPLQYYEDSNSSMEEIYKYDEDVDGLPNSFGKVYLKNFWP